MSISQDFTLDYQRIGAALCEYEASAAFSIFSHFIDAHAFQQFKIQVSSVSTSVLESYLDDLLGEKVPDDVLHIGLSFFNKNKVIEAVSLLGVGAAVAVGTHLSFSGTDPWWALGVALGLGSPFGIFFHTVFGHTNRRIRLARVVSFELSRRRGDLDENVAGAKVSLRQMLNPLSPAVTVPSQKVSIH